MTRCRREEAMNLSRMRSHRSRIAKGRASQLNLKLLKCTLKSKQTDVHLNSCLKKQYKIIFLLFYITQVIFIFDFYLRASKRRAEVSEPQCTNVQMRMFIFRLCPERPLVSFDEANNTAVAPIITLHLIRRLVDST